MKRREVHLTPEQRCELEQTRDHHEKAYMRTKAAAILKVAAGISIGQVAAHGLLKAVCYDTVRRWIDAYEQEGLQGLLVQLGRGRKPAFFPSV